MMKMSILLLTYLVGIYASAESSCNVELERAAAYMSMSDSVPHCYLTEDVYNSMMVRIKPNQVRNVCGQELASHSEGSNGGQNC